MARHRGCLWHLVICVRADVSTWRTRWWACSIRQLRFLRQYASVICVPYAKQVLQDPRQKRFFKARDMSDLFTLGSEYAGATETATIFAGLNGEVCRNCSATYKDFVTGDCDPIAVFVVLQ